MSAVLKLEPVQGVYNITNEEYHASKGLSRSSLWEFKKSPFHYWHKYINPNYVAPASTPAMAIGNAMHTALLEPKEFYNRYAVEEKIDRRTNAGKNAYNEMVEKNKGKIILSVEDKTIINNMCEVIFNDNQAKELITDAQYEQSIYWIDPETQLLCKVRPYIMHNHFIVDYKTTADASEGAFQRSIYNYGYYLQFAMIHEAIKHTMNKEIFDFVFLAQEKEEPYAVGIYQLEMSALEYGLNEFKSLLHRIKDCMELNIFPGYPTNMIALPAWSKS